MENLFVQTLRPDAVSGATIGATVDVVDVGAPVNDANDWIVAPPILSCKVGHTFRIFCNGSSNFELRTPATSGTTINNQDCDGTKEYLCTDTDTVIVTKQTTTNWIAQSITNLGAVRAAVVPD